jgi:mono/diheme cytochrome c family protein
MKATTLIIGWLAGGALIGSPLAGQQPDARAIYREECKLCHGVTGIPPKRALAKHETLERLSDTGFVGKLSVDSIVTILKEGISEDMKSFSGKLEDDEIHAVAVYIKELAAKRKG